MRGRTIKSTWNSFLDSLAYILSLEVNSNDLGADSFSHGESCWDCIDGVYLGSSFQKSPFDSAELGSG